jgi:hypothetical protein
MIFIPENTGLNFYDSSILLSPTGNIFRNDPTLFVDMNDDILLGFIPQNNNVIIKNVNIESASISSSVSLPASSLSGGLLYVQNNGTLTSNRPSTTSCVTYANDSKNPDASSKFRYFETGNIVGLGNTTNSNNGFNNVDYNIILSANNNQNTVFNNRRLNNHFSIYSSTDTATDNLGLHYSNSGVLVINGDVPLPYNNDLTSADFQTRLKVFGKVYADKFKTAAIGGSSGWYLRASDNNGNLELQPLTLPLNQTAFYPMSTSLDVANNYKIQLTQYKAYDSATPLAGGNDIDGGKTLVFKGGGLADDKWAVSSNFRARQGGCGGCFKGIEFGERASILQSNNMMAYSAGSFKVLAGNLYYDSYNGASQNAWYNLRTATSGIQNNELVSDFGTISSQPTAAANNTMSFTNTVLDAINGDNPNRNYIWQYQISLNAIWQSGDSVSTIDGASFVFQGAIKKIGTSITQLGTPTVTSYLPTGPRPVLTGVIAPFDGDNIPRLRVLGSGGTANYHIKWSASAQINQINLPSGAFSFQY